MITQAFLRNTQGRDFVVGDIHGSLQLLKTRLKEVGFDKSKDRLFSVGDLIDRGPDSPGCLQLIDEPWFFAVRGNHEQMFIDFCNRKLDYSHYFLNGGGWIREHGTEMLWHLAYKAESLPFAIEVATDNGLIGIIHAGIDGDCWQSFTRRTDDKALAIALWQRDLREKWVKDIHYMVCGHTIQPEPVTSGNQLFIDTGAFKSGKLCLLKIQDAANPASVDV